MSLDIDLIKSGDKVVWPYAVKIQWQEVSSGTLAIRNIPKYFDLRLDTILPSGILPAFLEFQSFTDIRWDKDVKVIEPENAESLNPMIEKYISEQNKGISYGNTDASSVFSTTESMPIDFRDM
jgi:hypothetical protein